MTSAFIFLVGWLIAGIGVIVLLTTKYKVHAFFALLTACFVVGLGVGLPIAEVIAITKDGFGNIMKSLGLIIVLGTALGILLEHTGSTKTMATFILKLTGERYAALGMSITGFIVGLPIFCDSGYIVLSGLNNSLAKRTGISMATMAVSLATGLYAVHCLIPPHPGAAAAAGIVDVDFGKLILYGILVAIPAATIGFAWASYAGKKYTNTCSEEHALVEADKALPSVVKAFMPVLVPVVLIAIKSFLTIESPVHSVLKNIFSALGDPVIALSVGVLLAFTCKRRWTKNAISALLKDAAEKAGGILVIIGAGGAFGAILAATKIGEQFSQSLALGSLGILFPFLLTFVLKTAQGSSTVAIITAASIVKPLLLALGLAAGDGPLLCVLAMGAGSMMISHANDAYFWVVAKFSGLDIKTMLRVYSVATVLMGLTSLLMVYFLSRLL
ncbi:MAG: GntP family permease [Ginsengibacter sp.]